MNYQEAFNKVLEDRGIGILENNFLFRSCLLDYVSHSFSDTDLVEAFCVLNKEPLHVKLSGHSYNDSLSIVKSLIKNKESKYSKETYFKSVEPLFTLLFPKPQQTQKPKKANNNKPKQKKKNNKTIFIDANCEKLTIYSTYANTVSFKKAGQYDNVKITKTSQGTEVFISSYGHYELRVPNDNKQTIVVHFFGEKLSLGKKNNEILIAKEINVDSSANKVYIDGNFEKVLVTEKVGKVKITGRIPNVIVNNDFGNTECDVSHSKPEQYVINSYTGKIKCFINGKGNIPFNKRLFHRLISVNSTCIINKRQVRIALNTKTGKIKL